MKINIEGLNSANQVILGLARRSASAVGMATSPIDGSFSSVHGVGDVGTIHQRVIATDPGSASNSLKAFDQQLQWLADTLQADANGFESQDLANSRGLDIADAGGSVEGEAMPVMNQPERLLRWNPKMIVKQPRGQHKRSDLWRNQVITSSLMLR